MRGIRCGAHVSFGAISLLVIHIMGSAQTSSGLAVSSDSGIPRRAVVRLATACRDVNWCVDWCVDWCGGCGMRRMYAVDERFVTSIAIIWLFVDDADVDAAMRSKDGSCPTAKV